MRTASVLQVLPGEVGLSSQTAVQVFGRAVDRLVFTLPQSVSVTGVDSSGLESWELSDTGRGRQQQTQVTLTYRRPFTGERNITLRGVFPTSEDESWDVPNMLLTGSDSQVTEIRLRSEPGVRLQVTDQDGVRPLPSDPQQRGELRFLAPRPDFQLSLLTATKSQQVHFAMTNLLSVHETGLELTTTLDVQTYFVPLFDVRITLPAEWMVSGARVSGSPVLWEVVSGEPGWQEVRVPLNPPLLPGETRPVDLSFRTVPDGWPVTDETLRLPLPEVRLPQASVVEAVFGISVDDGLVVEPQELTGLDPGSTGGHCPPGAKAWKPPDISSRWASCIRTVCTRDSSTFAGRQPGSRCRPSRACGSMQRHWSPTSGPR